MLKKVLLLNLCLLLLFSTLIYAEDEVEISGETITLLQRLLLVSKLNDEDDNQGVRVASNFIVQF